MTATPWTLRALSVPSLTSPNAPAESWPAWCQPALARMRSPPSCSGSSAGALRPWWSWKTSAGPTKRPSTWSGSSAGGQALLVLSDRDDQLARDHLWRAVLGDLVGGGPIARIHLSCLSATAVGRMSEPYKIDPDALFRITGGKAFFVSEVLAAGAGTIPESVHDAVLARVARLGPSARSVLDTIATAPLSMPLWLLEALTGDAIQPLPECVASGSVVVRNGEVSFRHELARMTLEADLGDRDSVALHRKPLKALGSVGTRSPDPARMAHHAEAAAAWRELGCDYEAAVVLASAGDAETEREALVEFQRLGARRAAALTARRLRERGERALPRGPRPSTRQNPALLTARELEVVAPVAKRLRNAEIAQRLHLTEKTVDHHLLAILGKLGVRSRTEAVQAAAALGLELPSS